MPKAVTGLAATHCSFGSSPSALLVPVGHGIVLNGQNRANVGDHIPVANILPFGMCSSPFNPGVIAAMGAPVPCMPITLFPWSPGDKTIQVGGKNSLDQMSINCCIWRGIIGIIYAGQSNWNVGDTVPEPEKKAAEENGKVQMQTYSETEHGKKMIKAVDDFKETDAGKEFLKAMEESKNSDDSAKLVEAVNKVKQSDAGKELIGKLSMVNG